MVGAVDVGAGVLRARSTTAVFLTLTSLLLASGCRRRNLPPRADGAAVVVAADIVPIAPDVTVAGEQEPNDDLATAQKIEFLAPLAPGIDGRLSPPVGKTRDVDLFRLVIPAPPGVIVTPGTPDGASAVAAAPSLRRRLAVEVRPEASLAVTVDVLDDQGDSLLSAAGGQPGEVEGFPNLSVTPGTYFVRVRATGQVAAGGYQLIARLAALELGEELEPNGRAALATEAPATGEMIGFAGWRRDQDWYRVPLAGLAEGSVLSVDLEPVSGVTLSLAVHDAAERRLTEARGRKEERVALRNLRVTATEPHLFVVVRAEGGRNAETRYSLRLRAELPRSGGELEPNDDLSHAQAISDGVTVGYLGRGDTDVYRLTAPGPTELDIELSPPERVDAKVEVLREDGAVVARVNAGKRHEAERLPNLFLGGGQLFLRLTAGRGDGNSDEPYRLIVASRAPEPGAEREPNDTMAVHTTLPAAAVGIGLLFPRGDVDVWRAPTPATPEGEVPVSVTGVVGLTLEVRVRSESGQELARFKVTGDRPVTTRVATGGAPCCVVLVREATGKGANPRDRYNLVVGR